MPIGTLINYYADDLDRFLVYAQPQHAQAAGA
jgi:hypothetical protein